MQIYWDTRFNFENFVRESYNLIGLLVLHVSLKKPFLKTIKLLRLEPLPTIVLVCSFNNSMQFQLRKIIFKYLKNGLSL